MSAGREIVVSVVHENLVLAMGLSALLQRHIDISVVNQNGALADVLVCSYRSASDALCSDRQPECARVLVVIDADQRAQMRALLRAGARGCLTLESCAEELPDAVRVVARGSHYVCRSGLPLLAATPQPSALTDRERETLRWVSKGYCNKRIAIELDIATATVKCHLNSIFGKLGVSTRTEASILAIRQGLVPVADDAELVARRPIPRSHERTPEFRAVARVRDRPSFGF